MQSWEITQLRKISFYTVWRLNSSSGDAIDSDAVSLSISVSAWVIIITGISGNSYTVTFTSQSYSSHTLPPQYILFYAMIYIFICILKEHNLFFLSEVPPQNITKKLFSYLSITTFMKSRKWWHFNVNVYDNVFIHIIYFISYTLYCIFFFFQILLISLIIYCLLYALICLIISSVL